MGIGLRIFYIKDDESIERIPWSQYEKMIYKKPGGNYPEFAGKKIKFAQIGVVFENRKPISVCYDNYYVLTFDSHGWLDEDVQQKERLLVMEITSQHIPHPHFGKQETNVIDAKNRFAKIRHEHFYKWKPSEKIVGEIGAIIFGLN